MSRRPISQDTQTTVLLSSRRRCCICFGLNRDANMKVGQIAHLDRNNANSTEENLAFLCFEHHDEYDSRTSQRKGLTEGEVRRFREELYRAVGKAFSVEVHFGSVSVPPEDPYAGQFIRLGGENDSAEIELTPIPDGLEGYPTYAVTGIAMRGTNSEYGPNLGEMGFIGSLVEGAIEREDDPLSAESYRLRLKFDGDRLVVHEENYLGMYGMGVTFSGEYRRA